MKMTAAVMYQQGLPSPFAETEPYKIEDVDLDGPGEGEVLVEIRAAGLCHSDLGQVQGLRRRKLPIVAGHEGAGIVREVGKGVTRLAPGDQVIMTGVCGCGHCPSCYDGKPVLCESNFLARNAGLLANGARKLSRNDVPIYHFSGVSTFAQYAVTVPASLIRIDSMVPLEVASIFGCAVVTGAGCVFNTAKVCPNQSVAVFGLGGVGLNAVMAAKISGAAEIIGIDPNEGKHALARELGCTQTFSARDPDLVSKGKDLTRGGVHYAFEISGARQAVAAALDITRNGGEVIGVGLGASDMRYDYAHVALVASEKAIRGSMMGGGVPQRDIPTYIGYYLRGWMPVDRLVSGTMGFEGLNQSLDFLDAGGVLRQILLPHG
jgi:Zn-dependent alcohol dehydrogenase